MLLGLTSIKTPQSPQDVAREDRHVDPWFFNCSASGVASVTGPDDGTFFIGVRHVLKEMGHAKDRGQTM